MQGVNRFCQICHCDYDSVDSETPALALEWLAWALDLTLKDLENRLMVICTVNQDPFKCYAIDWSDSCAVIAAQELAYATSLL